MKITLLVLSAGLVISGVSSAESLVRDPFQRPDLNKMVAPAPVVTEPDYLDEVNVIEIWHPRLKGTLRSASGSFANVEGTIIKVGEKIDEFRLLKVSERTATFVQDGETVMLSLDDIFENGSYKSDDDAL